LYFHLWHVYKFLESNFLNRGKDEIIEPRIISKQAIHILLLPLDSPKRISSRVESSGVK